MRIKNEKRQAKYPAAYICPWRNWITQRIPIPENGGSNPFGQAKKRTPYGVSFFGLFRIRRDLKPTVKKMPLWGIFREERLWRYSYAQDATGEVRGLGLYKVLRAEAVPEESMTPFMGAFSFGLPRIRRDLKPTVKKEAARKQPNNE